MQRAVTFLVKATGNRHKIIRCLNSIARQTNQNYQIVAFCSVGNLIRRLKRDYEGITVIKTADTPDFVTKVNAYFPKINTSHCLFVNFEEVLAPNTVDVILSQDKDVLLFNIARKNTKQKFVPRFPLDQPTDYVRQMQRGLLLWNEAIRTSLIQTNALTLQDYTPAMQALFLLECLSCSRSSAILQDVLVYKETLVGKHLPTFSQFEENRRKIKTLSKRFQQQGRLDIKQQLIMDFVVSQLSNYYEETGLFAKLRKRRLLKKYMVL